MFIIGYFFVGRGGASRLCSRTPPPLNICSNGWFIALNASHQWAIAMWGGSLSSFHQMWITNRRMCSRTSMKEVKKSCEVKGTKMPLLSGRTEHKGSWERRWRDPEAGMTRRERFSSQTSRRSAANKKLWLETPRTSRRYCKRTLCVQEQILYRPDEYFYSTI